MLRTVWARRWWIVVPALVSSVATFLITTLLPAKYESFVKIQVTPAQVPESLVPSTITASAADRLQAVEVAVLSRSRLERVINENNLYRDERRTGLMEDVVAQMRRDVRFEIDGQSPTSIRVGFVASNPRAAKSVAEKIAAMIMDENARDRENMSQNTHQFLETEASDAALELDAYDAKVAKYKAAHPGGAVPTSLIIQGKVLEDSYRAMLEKLQEARLASNLESRQGAETFKVIDPARVPEKAIGPSRSMMTSVAGLGGMLVGLVFAGTRRKSADSTAL